MPGYFTSCNFHLVGHFEISVLAAVHVHKILSQIEITHHDLWFDYAKNVRRRDILHVLKHLILFRAKKTFVQFQIIKVVKCRCDWNSFVICSRLKMETVSSGAPAPYPIAKEAFLSHLNFFLPPFCLWAIEEFWQEASKILKPVGPTGHHIFRMQPSHPGQNRFQMASQHHMQSHHQHTPQMNPDANSFVPYQQGYHNQVIFTTHLICLMILIENF